MIGQDDDPMIGRLRPETIAAFEEVARRERDYLTRQGKPRDLARIMERNGFLTPTSEAVRSERRNASSAVLHARLPTTSYAPLGFHLLDLTNGVLNVASSGGWSAEDEEELKTAAHRADFDVEHVNVALWDRMRLKRALRPHVTVSAESVEERFEALADNPKDGFLIGQAINDIIIEALEGRASDIHLEFLPETGEGARCCITHRVNGIARYMHQVPPQAMRPIMVRIKQEAGIINYGSREEISDGRISFTWQDRPIDIRVASMPAEPNGETVVLRLLDRATLKPFVTLFRHLPEEAHEIVRLVDNPTKSPGFIIVSGATGQGKTTTLCSVLMRVDRISKRVMTAESPIEYEIAYAKQTQVAPQNGRDFADHVVGFMRQDPDIIVIGETRDTRTAEAATYAAETGHLVMTSVHASNAPQTIERMISNFSDTYKSAGTYVLGENLRVIIHQILVPSVCPVCCVHGYGADVPEDVAAVLWLDPSMPITRTSPQGCKVCNFTGIGGRALAAETLVFPTRPDERAGVIKHLLGSVSSHHTESLYEITRLPGMIHRTRLNSIQRLVADGKVDPVMAVAFAKT